MSIVTFSKFDQLIYIVEESGLDDSAIFHEVKKLFPLFDQESDCYNDRHLSPYNLELYAHNRALGLPLTDVANASRMSATLLQQLHQGDRLSLETLLNLAKAEVFAVAEMKAKHLAAMESDMGPNAAAKFLEKAFAQQYGPKSELVVNSGFDAGEESPKWEVEIHHVETKDKRSNETR